MSDWDEGAQHPSPWKGCDCPRRHPPDSTPLSTSSPHGKPVCAIDRHSDSHLPFDCHEDHPTAVCMPQPRRPSHSPLAHLIRCQPVPRCCRLCDRHVDIWSVVVTVVCCGRHCHAGVSLLDQCQSAWHVWTVPLARSPVRIRAEERVASAGLDCSVHSTSLHFTPSRLSSCRLLVLPFLFPFWTVSSSVKKLRERETGRGKRRKREREGAGRKRREREGEGNGAGERERD